MSGRIQIIPFPVVPPGKCVLCGASHNRDGRKYLDFGMSLPNYGAVYWCTVCIGEATRPLGFLSPVEAGKLEEDWTIMNKTVQRLQEENGKLCTALSELDFLRRDRASVYDDSDLNEQGTTDVQGTGNEPEHIVELGKNGESGSAESSDVGGLEDVYSLINKPARLPDTI